MVTAKANLRLDIIETLAEFAALETAWSRLVDDSNAGPFATFEWITCWGKVFWGKDIHAHIFVVWEGERLVAALPLALEKKRVTHRLPLRVSTLHMLYDDRVGFHDVMMVSGYEAAMDLIFAACQNRAAYLDLTPIHPSAGLDALVACARKQGRWIFVRDEIKTAISDLSDGWETHLSRRSSSNRKRTRALERKLKDRSIVHSADQTDEAGMRCLDMVFDVSRRSWKAKLGTDIGTKETDRAFFTNLFKTLAPKGRMHLVVLELDGVAVGTDVVLCEGTSAYALVSDYDEAYADQAVGRFVSDQSMCMFAYKGKTHFDMLRATHFTSSFADRFVDYQRVRIALRPGLARWIIQGEALARRIARAVTGKGSKVTGRRKFFGNSARAD